MPALVCMPSVVQVSVSVDKDNAESRQLKPMMHRVAPSLIRQQLQQYLTSMRQGKTDQ